MCGLLSILSRSNKEFYPHNSGQLPPQLVKGGWVAGRGKGEGSQYPGVVVVRTGQFAEVCPPPQYMCDSGSDSTGSSRPCRIILELSVILSKLKPLVISRLATRYNI